MLSNASLFSAIVASVLLLSVTASLAILLSYLIVTLLLKLIYYYQSFFLRTNLAYLLLDTINISNDINQGVILTLNLYLPTGGRAYGIPRKLAYSLPFVDWLHVPCKTPLATLTTGLGFWLVTKTANEINNNNFTHAILSKGRAHATIPCTLLRYRTA